MWRGLPATTGDLVAFLDTDTEDFTRRVRRRAARARCSPTPASPFVKGAFRRPLRVGDTVIADEGGRVTELVARPLLNLHVPELAGFLPAARGRDRRARARCSSGSRSRSATASRSRC